VAVAAARLEPGRVAGWTDAAEGAPVRYLDGLRRAGVLPVLIAPTDEASVTELLEPFAGLLLTGGADVHPELYGEQPHASVYGVDPERDRREIALVRAALARRLPLFAICRGTQVLNVALGGTLVQHLPDLGHRVAHGVPVGMGEPATHPVDVAAGSRLAAAVGEDPVLKGCVSIHHQAIATLAPGLQVTARSSDGLVEAVETPADGAWCLAVQWHPERSADIDPAQQAVFDAFARAAGLVTRVADRHELTASDRVAAGGDAIGHLADGRVVFVEGALPGETVTVDVVEWHRDFAKARVVRVGEAAPGRVEPPCPELARGCGGCQWQHVTPQVQRDLKQQIVSDALARIGGLTDPPIPVTLALPTRGYRTTAHLAVDGSGQPAYRRRHAHEPVPVGSCLVAHPALEEMIVTARLPGHRRVTMRVGLAGGERLVVLDRRVSARPFVPDGVRVVGPGKTGFVHEEVGGRRWRVSAHAFFQSGPAAAGALADAVDAALGDAPGPAEVLVDLYAGVGVLGGIAAGRRLCRLVAVEQHPEAVADARVNLAGLDARVVAAEIGTWRPAAAAAVIADPARPGLGRPGVAAVSATGAGRLVLVSCDPASLGRDAALLAADGWELAEVSVVDAFAHTVHVEVVSRFERR
jgi:23S rRNA (uracil1939-C5)-methyltransferase